MVRPHVAKVLIITLRGKRKRRSRSRTAFRAETRPSIYRESLLATLPNRARIIDSSGQKPAAVVTAILDPFEPPRSHESSSSSSSSVIDTGYSAGCAFTRIIHSPRPQLSSAVPHCRRCSTPAASRPARASYVCVLRCDLSLLRLLCSPTCAGVHHHHHHHPPPP